MILKIIEISRDIFNVSQNHRDIIFHREVSRSSVKILQITANKREKKNERQNPYTHNPRATAV